MSESTLLEPQQTQENKIESALERMQDDTQEASVIYCHLFMPNCENWLNQVGC